MARFIKDISATKGQAPGSLFFIGDQKIATPIIKVMEYDTDSLIEKTNLN